FEILAPHAALDQRCLDACGGFRARHQFAEIGADQRQDFPAQGIGTRLVAARLLLDHPFEQRHDEGHPGGLDGLEVDRRQEHRQSRVGRGGGAIGHDGFSVAHGRVDRIANMRCCSPALGDVAHRSEALGGDVYQLAIAHCHHTRMGMAGYASAANHNALKINCHVQPTLLKSVLLDSTASHYECRTSAQPPLFSLAKIASITRIEAIASSMPHGSGFSPSTASAKASACSVYWSTAVRISRLASEPSKGAPVSTVIAVRSLGGALKGMMISSLPLLPNTCSR